MLSFILFVWCFLSLRTAAAIRTASMTCVQALLQGDMLSSDQLSASLDDLLPKVSTVDTQILLLHNLVNYITTERETCVFSFSLVDENVC